MSLDKGIIHGKEKRKQYYGSKAFDRSCRPHGGCDYCARNRLHNTRKRKERLEEQLRELQYEVE